jgi:hypothetical protein
MAAGWGSTRIEERRLAKKNKGPIGVKSSLRFGDLFQRASKVDGSGRRAFTSSPGNRSAGKPKRASKKRVARHVPNRPKNVFRQFRKSRSKWLYQRAVAAAVASI